MSLTLLRLGKFELVCVFISAMFSFNLIMPAALALDPEQKRIQDSNIRYFDVEKALCTPGGTATEVPEGCDCPSDGEVISGENASVQVYNYLINEKDLGLTPTQVAGIIGNLMNETGGNGYKLVPTSVGIGQCDPNCYGIAQWSISRTAALRSWAQSKGKDPTKLLVQAEFIKVELLGSEGVAFGKLKAVTGDDETAAKNAAEQFDKWYERSSAGRQERMDNAARFFKEYVKGQGLTGGPPDSNQTCASGGGSGSSSGDFAWPDDNRKDRLTSCFGPRVSPGGIGSRNHQGVDIGSAPGENVTAADGGKVESAGGDFNNTITIDHGNGTKTKYLHNNSVSVSVGQKVSIGDVIGKVGSKGQSTAPHIHFEVIKGGRSVNPLEHLPKEGRTVTGENCSMRTF